MKKIVIAGGTGFLGKFLASRFRAMGAEVVIISRNSGDVRWSDRQGLIGALENADLLVNLAGRSVDCRYNKQNKKEILRLRVDTTTTLGDAILQCSYPPLLWINSSTATIYRHAEDRSMTEHDGEIGKGFSVDVAQAWEKAFFDYKLPATRQVALRMAIVLGEDGGVMRPLKRLVRFGLSGKQGSGRQMFSWIHIEDVLRIILFLVDHPELGGAINCSSPNPVTNEVFMQSLRTALHVKVGLPSPGWLLKVGAVLIRTETELVLKSRWVVPHRLLQAGYAFAFPTLRSALEKIST